jgi:hypothetical protein
MDGIGVVDVAVVEAALSLVVVEVFMVVQNKIMEIIMTLEWVARIPFLEAEAVVGVGLLAMHNMMMEISMIMV